MKSYSEGKRFLLNNGWKIDKKGGNPIYKSPDGMILNNINDAIKHDANLRSEMRYKNLSLSDIKRKNQINKIIKKRIA